MNAYGDSSAQAYPQPEVNSNARSPVTPSIGPTDARIRRESSDSDDIPLRDRANARHRGRESIGHPMSMRPRRSADEPLKQPAKEPESIRKKPGPRPWAAKPIMKNDMAAKMEVIREIERYWGKNFIKNYIPKCHRPLVKRKGHRRPVNRDRETNPRNWLPSVLKAVLMIARLTNDKMWLKNAMREVVRYRIKHTGNRKPQLVTTDFDVIEDMYTKGWDCQSSFQIRYKHLLMNQTKGYEENEEYIDDIMKTSSQDEDSDLGDDNDAHQEGDEDADDDAGMDDGEQDLSTGHHRRSGYIVGAPHYVPKKIVPWEPKSKKKAAPAAATPPAKPTAPVKSPAADKHRPPPPFPSQEPYGYGALPYGYGGQMGYGMPTPGYGSPMHGYPPHIKGYPPHMQGYLPFHPYGGYTQKMPGTGRGDPNRSEMQPFPQENPMSQRGGGFYQDAGEDGEAPPAQPRFSPFGHHRGRALGSKCTPSVAPIIQPNDRQVKIKAEPGVEHLPISIDDLDGPDNDLGAPDGVEESEETLALALQEAEAEHRLIQLRAKMAKIRQTKNK